ncbi:hypothetical protein DFH09DRAFT_1073328 [Mycena vulgaris]|nr:hypothetical protein DFH09DRAFT_1073328 [Mycena vulgaris]
MSADPGGMSECGFLSSKSGDCVMSSPSQPRWCARAYAERMEPSQRLIAGFSEKPLPSERSSKSLMENPTETSGQRPATDFACPPGESLIKCGNLDTTLISARSFSELGGSGHALVISMCIWFAQH